MIWSKFNFYCSCRDLKCVISISQSSCVTACHARGIINDICAGNRGSVTEGTEPVDLLISFLPRPTRETHCMCQNWRHLLQLIFQQSVLPLQGHLLRSNRDLQRDEGESTKSTHTHTSLGVISARTGLTFGHSRA